MTNEITKTNDFVEIKYTGYSNGNIFDSNIEEDLKKLDEKAKPVKTIVSIGNEMLVKGFDKALEGKEIGKEYEVLLAKNEGFGNRNRNLMKTIPLKVFHEKNVDPKPGMTFVLDEMLVKIIAVSGARVIADFNNPLAGKEIKYKFTIIRKVEDEKEKCDALFSSLFRFVPEYEIKEKIIVRSPKGFELFVNSYKDKFKKIIGKELIFEEKKEETKPIKLEEKKEEPGKEELKEKVKSEENKEVNPNINLDTVVK